MRIQSPDRMHPSALFYLRIVGKKDAPISSFAFLFSSSYSNPPPKVWALFIPSEMNHKNIVTGKHGNSPLPDVKIRLIVPVSYWSMNVTKVHLCLRKEGQRWGGCCQFFGFLTFDVFLHLLFITSVQLLGKFRETMSSFTGVEFNCAPRAISRLREIDRPDWVK